MLFRLIFALLCLAATAGYLDREQRAGRLQHVDEKVLSFMVASARERLKKTPPKGEVVLVEMRAEDRDEYAAWPPPPLDWHSLLKELQVYEPEVLLIATPLNWGRPTPDFAPAVAEALLKFPIVVLGVETQLAEGEAPAGAFWGDLESSLPRFSQVEGDATLAPALSSLITAPDAAVRASSEMGLLCAQSVKKDVWRLPYAVRDGSTLIPTALAQTLARHSHSAYLGGHRLRLGEGSGAYLQNETFIPLEPGGEHLVKSGDAVPVINALDLMTGGLADTVSASDKALLENTRILVLGTTGSAPQSPALPRLYAQALNRLLAMPRLGKLTEIQQWVIWALAALAALGLALRVPREKVFLAGLGIVCAGFVATYLLFQTTWLWFPPTLPGALLAVGMIFGRLFGKRKPEINATNASESSGSDVTVESQTPTPSL